MHDLARTAAACLGAVSVFALPGSALPANERAVATIDTPAVVRIPAAEAEASDPDATGRLVLGVTGFVPSPGGPVQIIVKVAKDGGAGEREIGRFGVFPNAAFSVADPSRARRFGLTLPPDLAQARSLRVGVYIAPLRGDGRGARLDLGSVALK